MIDDLSPGSAGEGGRRKIINDFINDFPQAGEAGGKMINDFPPAGEAGGKMINDFPPVGEAATNCTLEFAKLASKKSSVPSLQNMGAGDATKTGRSVLNFSEESARRSPGARKSPKNGNPETKGGSYLLLLL